MTNLAPESLSRLKKVLEQRTIIHVGSEVFEGFDVLALLLDNCTRVLIQPSKYVTIIRTFAQDGSTEAFSI